MKIVFMLFFLSLTACAVTSNLLSACVGSPVECARVTTGAIETAKTVADAAKGSEDQPADAGGEHNEPEADAP
ncbi:hypothetical protein HBA55_34945 [Pseudomaricurvus alkylphenolicus]|uniref:hypothetical protein n=1 Tax=Pseudomaricurvus alkylphenolicus TaxID=1306991 RepID=UPI0014215463|nr:hypothetical protein [Pseudomaricurvus alkylphenolicus]NIB44831.1 hypothetical protein [Pseudomaricurvus alkylphenolicus]